MPMTMHSTDGRADATRRQILRAASHQFARRAYHDVGLDDILADAELTKGAMYFHFRSKHALAVAIIDKADRRGRRRGGRTAEAGTFGPGDPHRLLVSDSRWGHQDGCVSGPD